MKLKQKILRIFELIITFGLADWLRENDRHLVKEFLEKEKKLHGIMYCCGDPSADSYDERLLCDIAKRDYLNNSDEWDEYYKLKEQEEKKEEFDNKLIN